MVAAIQIRNLKKRYGHLWAVNNISFDVKDGEVFAFLGPNGAGKTTTVEMIETIRVPTGGTIRVLGKDLRKDVEFIKERIGVLPQEFRSYDRLTVRETLLYFQAFYRKRTDVDELIELVNMEDKKDELYMNLSGGLKQRVGIAVALVNDPNIVFLDEPTTGLDPRARQDVWKVIRGLRSKGKTVFLTTHYMEEAEILADNVCVIHRGNIIAQGTVQELIDRFGKSSRIIIRGCNAKRASAAVAPLGLKSSSPGNGDLTIPVGDREMVLDVLSALKNKNVKYRQVDIRRPNLEEVFLNLTGESLTDEEGKM